MDRGDDTDAGALSDKALAALNATLLDIASQRATAPLLQRLVDTARSLVGARYAALGIPDGAGGFSQFITSGMTASEIHAIGPLPRVHGMLGAMLAETTPFRTVDITADPRFQYWPPEHPVMGSFLGVPVLADGEVSAAFYLTDKQTAAEFSLEDQAMISALAAHAGVAIENARLWERAREASMTEERDRIARDLHDAMSQTLFSLQLTAASAADAIERDPAEAAAHIGVVRELARSVQEELRSLVVDLRPPDLEADGLAGALRKHAALLARAHSREVVADVDLAPVLDPRVERDLLRIAQEALHNALRHAQASRIDVRLRAVDGGAVLEVSDNGAGFDPSDRALRATRLGIVSMRHRARSVGARLEIDSAPGSGTTVRVRVGRRDG
ncbi:MAG TPA: GAF domain-containing sensor histidine kinase [Egibacteraceae bacterium]|nr:GAF domain-containing sensor histidine kinase [Egibacteraceae bacterium]